MKWRIVLCAAITAIIFVIDCVFVVSPAVSVLYIIPLLMIANAGKSHWVMPWSCTCVALTVAAFVIGMPLSFGPLPLPNLAIGLTAIIVTAHQLIKSARMQSTLSADERRYRGVFNTLAVAIWECDFRPVEDAVALLRASGVSDLRSYLVSHPQFVDTILRKVPIIDVNETALKLLGVPTKGDFFRFLGEFVPNDDGKFRDCIIAIDERHALFQAQTAVRSAEGDTIEIIVAFSLGGTGSLDRVPNSILNVTEQSRLDALIADTREQLSQVQQTAALGQISASIAHELDQPLTAVQTSAAAAMRWLRPGRNNVPEAMAALEMVDKAAARSKEVIQRIRSLVGKAETQAHPLEIDDLLQEALLLVQGDIATGEAKFSQRLNAPAIVQADRVLLQQVLINLVRNALQAMAEVPAHERLLTVESLVDDGRAKVRVSDTGPGWPEELRAQAFQPFRTTKATGMGLGLSICRTIIEAHEGQISLGDTETRGATVEFSLPISDGIEFEVIDRAGDASRGDIPTTRWLASD